MFHRYFSRCGQPALRLAVISSLLTAGLSSSRGQGLDAVTVLRGDSVQLAADSSCSLTANETAQVTLNEFCRAARQPVSPVSPHCPLPAEPLPLEKALSAEDAESDLQVIGQLSGVQTPCSATGNTPDSVLEVINSLVDCSGNSPAGATPVSCHQPLPSIVPPDKLNSTSTRVSDVYGQAKASVLQQK